MQYIKYSVLLFFIFSRGDIFAQFLSNNTLRSHYAPECPNIPIPLYFQFLNHWTLDGREFTITFDTSHQYQDQFRIMRVFDQNIVEIEVKTVLYLCKIKTDTFMVRFEPQKDALVFIYKFEEKADDFLLKTIYSDSIFDRSSAVFSFLLEQHDSTKFYLDSLVFTIKKKGEKVQFPMQEVLECIGESIETSEGTIDVHTMKIRKELGPCKGCDFHGRIPGGNAMDFVEKNAFFPGGQSAMLKFIQENLNYPKVEHPIKTRLIVRFVVEKDGSIGNFESLRSIGPKFDAEAIRVLKMMPKWTPGEQNGEAVRQRYTLPIIFEFRG